LPFDLVSNQDDGGETHSRGREQNEGRKTHDHLNRQAAPVDNWLISHGQINFLFVLLGYPLNL
jgi:hypothetical protein